MLTNKRISQNTGDNMKTEKQAKQEILASNWTVKAVKYSRGHDADCMECNLYFNDKLVANVWDDSYGGGFQFTWKKGTEAIEKDLNKLAKSFTVESQYLDDGMTYDEDIVVDELVQDFNMNKETKRFLRKIVYLNNGAIYSLPAKFKPIQKHLDGVKNAPWWKESFVLLNELSFDDAKRLISVNG